MRHGSIEFFADAVFDTEQTQINRLRKLNRTEPVIARLLIKPLRKFHENILCHGRNRTASLGRKLSLAEGGVMMNGGMPGVGNWMGGCCGMWVPILLVVLVVGVVAWFIKGRGK